MRHRVDHRKLGRTRAHRKAMLANMVMSLFDKERITTTDARAKEARRTAERLITRAKKGYAAYKEHQSLKEAGKDVEAKQMQAVALAHWRQASRVVKKRNVLKKLFDEIAPQYLERPGGYTRILHLGTRPGDNAKKVLLELVESDIAAARPTRTKKKTAKGQREGAEEKAAASKKKTKGKKAEAKVEKKPEKEAEKKTKKKGKEEKAAEAADAAEAAPEEPAADTADEAPDTDSSPETPKEKSD